MIIIVLVQYMNTYRRVIWHFSSNYCDKLFLITKTNFLKNNFILILFIYNENSTSFNINSYKIYLKAIFFFLKNKSLTETLKL